MLYLSVMGSESAIKIDRLSKRYPKSDHLALDQLSLEVKPGEVYGFLGPNGAGKSTTIRLLMNFIQPTRGSAAILGKDIVKDSVEIKRSIGYLAGDVVLYPKMTGRRFLYYMGELYSASNANYLRSLIKRFGADTNKPIGQLSKGNRQKIGLIQAFMHQPEVLILDEPTSGLDPLMQEQFFELVRETRDRGASVFVSSHNLNEVQKMCDRVGFIKDGKLIVEQNLADIAASTVQTFDISFAHEAPISELKAIKHAKVQPAGTQVVTIHIHGNLSKLFGVLARHEVRSINQRESNLEEEFLHFYGKGAGVK